MPNKPTAILLTLICLATLLWFFHEPNTGCNVAYLKLHGDVVTYIPVTDSTTTSSNPVDETASEDITKQIRDANRDSHIKAIVLEIDSPGGSPVGGEEMELALKRSQKSTVALIRSQGDSAAYEVATGANVIFASAESEVGDIGITQSYIDNTKKDNQDGLTFHQLSIGKYKDMLDPDKPLTPAEKDLIMSQLQVGYDRFVEMVADGRHMSTTTALKLADGSEVIGQTALAEGLIDKIGNVDDVRDYLTQKLKTPAVICSIDQ